MEISAKRKRTSAIQVMRCMLDCFSARHHIPYHEALLMFAKSHTFESLFDFDTDYWKYGPSHLESMYEQELGNDWDPEQWYPDNM